MLWDKERQETLKSISYFIFNYLSNHRNLHLLQSWSKAGNRMWCICIGHFILYAQQLQYLCRLMISSMHIRHGSVRTHIHTRAHADMCSSPGVCRAFERAAVVIAQRPRVALCVSPLCSQRVHWEVSWTFNMSSNLFLFIIIWQLDCYQAARQRHSLVRLTPKWAACWPGISPASGINSSDPNCLQKCDNRAYCSGRHSVFSDASPA